MLLQTTSIPSCLHVQTSTSCTLNQSTSPVLVTWPWHSLTFRTYVGVSGVEAEGPGQGGVVSDWLIGRRQGQTYSPRSTCLTYCTVRVRSKCPRGTGFTGVVEGSSGGAIILFVTQGTLHWLNGTCKTMFKIIDIHNNSFRVSLLQKPLSNISECYFPIHLLHIYWLKKDAVDYRITASDPLNTLC